MKNCPEFEERVNDYLDDMLEPEQRAGVERHLEGCEGCRELLRALRSLRERAAALPPGLEPERDLWPDIRVSLARQKRGWTRLLPVLPIAPAGLRPVGVSFAAAAALLVLSVTAWMVLRPTGSPEIGSAPGGMSARSALPLLDAGYGEATEQLRDVLLEKGTGGSPDAVRVIERNLRIVEGAIREMRRAAEVDPVHAVDRRLYTSLHRTRFELLRQAVRLSSQGGEERTS